MSKMTLTQEVEVPQGYRLVGYLSSHEPVVCTRAKNGRLVYRIVTGRGALKAIAAAKLPARLTERVAKWQHIPTNTPAPVRENVKAMPDDVKAKFDRKDVRSYRHTHGLCGCGHHVGATCKAVKDGYETAETYKTATD